MKKLLRVMRGTVTWRSLACAAALVGLAAVYLAGSLRTAPAEVHTIWIDAGRPRSIVAPFEIVEIGERGELGLWLPAEAGRGWCGEAGGEATYQCFVPEGGDYVIWGYCLWHDTCTRSVFVQVDGLDKAILGNDPVYDKWHWAKGFSLRLERGLHTIRLLNHSDNIAVRALLLVNDAQYAPPGADPLAAADLFSDDFNGCDKGNFPLWRKLAGEWEVQHPADRENKADNVLIGRSTDTAALMLKTRDWGECRLAVQVLVPASIDSSAAVGIRYGVRDERNYRELRWSKSPGGTGAVLRHLRCLDGAVEGIASHEIPWQYGLWHDVQIDVHQGHAQILLDNGLSLTGGEDTAPAGGIGLALYGKAEAQFDNVRVQSLAERRP
jgi:hypothetical protein